MKLDIVILPPKNLSDKIGKFTGQVNKKVRLSTIIDNKNRLPHISLLHMRTDLKKLQGVIRELEKIAKCHKRFGLGFERGFAWDRIVSVVIKNSPSLAQLHKKVVLNVSGQRNGITRLPKKSANKTQAQYFRKYGVANILKFFRPHITLAWVSRRQDLATAVNLVNGFNWKNFTAERLAVTKVDSKYQVREIIKEFRLK